MASKVSIRGLDSSQAYHKLVDNGYPKLPNKGPGSAHETVARAIAEGVVTQVVSGRKGKSAGGKSDPW